jgi:NitT/TauT family transport system ATP-binding protein
LESRLTFSCFARSNATFPADQDHATLFQKQRPQTPDRDDMLDIQLRNVTLHFQRPDTEGRLPVYEDFNLDVEQGSFTILLGPSGCGKSTLLHVIDGLVRPTRADEIRVLGKDIRASPDVTRHIGYVFQQARLLPWKTLKQNVEFGLRGLNLRPRNEWDQLIDKYFSVVGLRDYLNYYPAQVSGGMQQRVSIVRAWVNEPQILLMDEPFSHLDEITAGELRRELIRLWMQDEVRRTIVFVTHDISEAVYLGQDIVMLTPRPAEICFTMRIDLPFPRDSTDDSVFDYEKQLRKEFAERAGVRI